MGIYSFTLNNQHRKFFLFNFSHKVQLDFQIWYLFGMNLKGKTKEFRDDISPFVWSRLKLVCKLKKSRSMCVAVFQFNLKTYETCFQIELRNDLNYVLSIWGYLFPREIRKYILLPNRRETRLTITASERQQLCFV